ncbi:MAG: glycoside hydrolase family 15 protein [Chloroflexi bacterium]|nr:glycoside hydrolase family 15 protein [Chloroflexota bacterium]
MAYQPIEDYGIIGDLHTAALVGVNGSIDWFCVPHFDSPSVFAALLDDKKGGRFKIAPTTEGATSRQFYWPETNVLITRFLSTDGVGELADYMPVGTAARRSHGHHRLVRRVTCIRGTMTFRMECSPAFDYGRAEHTVSINSHGAVFESPDLKMALYSPVPVEQAGGALSAEFTLEEGQVTEFVIGEIRCDHDDAGCVNNDDPKELFQQTVDYWQSWVAKITYKGRWREIVQRSALALKLLTYEPTGAIVAAPTTSLPEEIGGVRNWDYRYTWIRDAAFTVYGFIRIGLTDEAARFMEWIEARCSELNPDGSLQLVYGIDGRHEMPEEELGHLEGYRGSAPVRIGNGAAKQLQLDIYGELMDSVYLYDKYGSPISYDFWNHLRRLIDWVADNWQREDEGIWEVRGGRRHFVYSKLMCWVALDRGIRLANKRSFPADRDRWLDVRDEIYEWIQDKGWNEEIGAFVQSEGSDALDASNLLMPLVFFMSPSDPRMRSTLKAINRPLNRGGLVSNSLVYRYNPEHAPDGLAGAEGTFNICTFWLVEAMTRAGRTDKAMLDEARLDFEQMLGYSNHLSLYAEETGLHGEALGNFPQAFTHLALISAAFNLDRAMGGNGGGG